MQQYRAFKKFFFISLTLLILLVASSMGLDIKYKKPSTVSKNDLIPTPKSSTVLAEMKTVKRVIDGDTIELSTGEKVRYIGVDTPELHDPKKPAQCFAQEAMEQNKKLVEGKTVRLEKDVSNVDRYKRLLRYAYITNPVASSGSILINDYLIRQGYGYAATFPPDVKHSQEFILAQTEARLNSRGLWDKCK